MTTIAYADDNNDSVQPSGIGSLLNAVFHVSPDEIRQAFQMNKEIGQASVAQPPTNQQIQSAVKRINLSSGQQAPLLHVVEGYIANVQFVGGNGQPWPVIKVISGNQDVLFASGGEKDNPYNVTLQAIKPFYSTNVAVYLAGRNMPVMLYVQTEQDTLTGIDTMVSYLLDGYPPGTSVPSVANQRNVSDSLLNALDAYPGDSWSPVNVSDNASPFAIKMWTQNDGSTILRISQGQLISPNWDSSVNNSDGTTTAYEFSHTPLLLVISDKQGHTYQVAVSDPTQALANTINTNNNVQHASVQEF